MDEVLKLLNFILQNWEPLAALAVAVIGVVSRRVSKSKAKALEGVVQVIEELDVREFKRAIEEKSKSWSPSVSDALDDAVRRVDPKKRAPSPCEAALREAVRLAKVSRNRR